MKLKLFLRFLCITCLLRPALLAQPNKKPVESYAEPPEVRVRGDVPKGRLTQHQFRDSRIFPGTERDYWVYVPAQYDGSRPACLMVFQDGKAYISKDRGARAPTVFDNLIHAGDMPVMVGVFVNPGVVPAVDESSVARYNRSFEYDGLGDLYARFLIEELLPEVEKVASVKLSRDPNDRGIGGASSGAICAFNVAWSRPDSFRRVQSSIGTYIGLRGADELPVLIRKTEAKPLRIHLQAGSNDLNIYCGDWWMANQTLLRALQWQGYEVAHVWGEGGHNRKHEAAIFPDAMRYLWKNWPASVHPHPENAAGRRQEFIYPGVDWERVAEGFKFTEGPVVNAQGELFFSDIPNAKIHRVNTEGEVDLFAENTGGANGLMFAPDGQLIVCANEAREIRTYSPDGRFDVLAKDVTSNDVAVRADGSIYFTDPRGRKIWRIPNGNNTRAEVVDDDFPGCNGIVFSPDQTALHVSEYPGRYVWSYRVHPDGRLVHKQRYSYLHLPPRESRSLANGMCCDDEGFLYVATALGVQICDQPGRVHFIMPLPVGARHPSNLCFGGKKLNYLYATCGDKIYRRELKRTGVQSWNAPVKQVKPRL